MKGSASNQPITRGTWLKREGTGILSLIHISVLVFGCRSLLFAQVPANKPVDLAQQKFWDIQSTFQSGIDAVENAYRQDLSALFASANKAVIYLLDFEMDNTQRLDPSDELFPIAPYSSCSRIISRRALGPNEIKKVIGPLAEMVKKSTLLNGGAMCHFPVHGLRLWRGDQLVFESSFCWECNNYYLRYPMYGDRWHATTPAIAAVLKELLPIPRKQIMRFEKRFAKPEQALPIQSVESTTHAIENLEKSYVNSIQYARGHYDNNLADLLQDAGLVEVCQLNPEAEREDSLISKTTRDQLFPAQELAHRILARRELMDEERKLLISELRVALSEHDNDNTPREFFPLYGIRIWKDNELLLKSRFDTWSNQLAFNYPDGYEARVAITPTLHKIVETLLPLPEEMRERMRKKNQPSVAKDKPVSQ